jgi:hypothetical protein
MKRFAALAALSLLAAAPLHAQCSSYSTSIYSNNFGINVTVNNLPAGTNVSSAMSMWNSGCGMYAEYPQIDFDSSYTGSLTINYISGHQASATCVNNTQYCRGLWDPSTRSITIYEEAGDPANPANWNNLSDAQRTNIIAHEFGHALGLHDDACFSGIMNVPVSPTAGMNPDECTSADNASHVPYEGTSNQGCQDFLDCHMSPILIDLAHDGMHLSGVADGVLFDLDGDGLPDRTAWTAAGADEAFLWIDNNGNGVVDNGTELFGSAMAENGFEAIASFDRRDEGDVLWGGNANETIDAGDRVWSHLRLWVDANHDGVSQPEEIFTLAQKGVVALDLGYSWSGRRDGHDNQFRYRAPVAIEQNGHRVTGQAYDVFFKVGR